MLKWIKRAAVAAVVLGCGVASAETRLQGAGATFPNPIYQRWVNDYQKSHPGVAIDYQSIGSGGGIKGLVSKTIDFAGSDAPMSAKEQQSAGAPVVHIPTVAGAVVPAYNLPGFQGELKLTGEVIADIYGGRITAWNDAKIAALNEGTKLPATQITPAWRTDGSGTTFVFTSYLCTQSPEFKASVSSGKSVDWPSGQGGKGNEGVTAVVQQTPGAIGYIELNYAIQNHIAFASVKNADGKFVKASTESVSAAGAAAMGHAKGDSLAVDLWNQKGENVYPISAYTYIIVYKDLSGVGSKAKAEALVNFLSWATGDGQDMAAAMDYAPLAAPVREKVRAAIGSLTFSGSTLKVADAK